MCYSLHNIVNFIIDFFCVYFLGHWSKITDNMFIFNLTTPIKNKNYNIQFGLSEENRHIVAQIKTPSHSVGIELLCTINNLTDFYIKFNLATPFEFIEDIAFIGKYKHDRADFRIGWNHMQIGFAGVWYFDSLLNFEHSYKIFTPIKGYEENVAIVKLILANGIEAEFSVRITNIKVGVTLESKRKPNILEELGFHAEMQKKIIYPILNETETTVSVVSSVPTEENFWTGFFHIEPYFYPTVKGTFDYEQKESLRRIFVSVKLPKGGVEILDELDVKGGPLSFNNELKITSPFEVCKEIKSSSTIEMIYFDSGLKFDVLLNLNVLYYKKWYQVSKKNNIWKIF